MWLFKSADHSCLHVRTIPILGKNTYRRWTCSPCYQTVAGPSEPTAGGRSCSSPGLPFRQHTINPGYCLPRSALFVDGYPQLCCNTILGWEHQRRSFGYLGQISLALLGAECFVWCHISRCLTYQVACPSRCVQGKASVCAMGGQWWGWAHGHVNSGAGESVCQGLTPQTHVISSGDWFTDVHANACCGLHNDQLRKPQNCFWLRA